VYTSDQPQARDGADLFGLAHLGHLRLFHYGVEARDIAVVP
jgi:hypothetical protein